MQYKAEGRNFMKREFHPIITETIIEDKFPGIWNRLIPWIESLEKCLERMKLWKWMIHKLRMFFIIYFDIVKDIFCIYISVCYRRI